MYNNLNILTIEDIIAGLAEGSIFAVDKKLMKEAKKSIKEIKITYDTETKKYILQ